MVGSMNGTIYMPVGEVCSSISDTYREKKNMVTLINTSDVLEGRVLNHERVPNSNLKGQFKKTFQRDDILYSEIRPQNRRFAYVDFSPIDYIASTKLMVIRAKKDVVSPKYLYYFLKNTSTVAELQLLAETRSGTFPQITFSEVANLTIPVPSLAVQEVIVQTMQCLEDKITCNEQINDNLYAQAKAIFDNHFINIDAIPAGWRKGNLLDIANYLNGLAMQKFRPQGHEIGLPVLKIKELRQGSCDDSSELCSLSIKPEYIIHNGDVVFSWSGSLLVDIWCGGTCGLNQHLFKVTSDVYDKWFYYLWTAHHLARFIAIAADKATTMGHIKREELAKAEVLIPCEEDYTSFNSIMQPIFELIISNRIESRKLAALRDELLPKLMTGEIDVSDVQL